MTRIYLIRHTEAEGNTRRLFQGHYDGAVSENGRLQLEKLRQRCREYPFAAIYSSPLKRAMETARAARGERKLPIETDERLMEICGGRWEGKPWGEIPQLYPEENRLWEHEPWNFEPEGGEPMRSVYARMRQIVTEIARKNPGRTVCVVSHGCAIRNFLCWAQGWPIERLPDVPWVDNTAVSVIDFDDALTPHVCVLGDNSHLSGGLSTIEKQSWWKKSGPTRDESAPAEGGR